MPNISLKLRFTIFTAIIIILALISIYYPTLTTKTITNIQYPKETTHVIKVIDGDTIKTENQTIRLLGINTPEKNQPYYPEAKTYLQQIENKTIQVQRDMEDIDKYNRKLRYVFYNNQLINTQIIEQGLATTYITEELEYKNQLIRAEQQARFQQLNLWKKSTNECSQCIKLKELNSEKEFFIIQNICSIQCNLQDWTVKDDANHITKLNPIQQNQQQTYNSESNIWNNAGDRFFMRDEQGSLVIFYEY